MKKNNRKSNLNLSERFQNNFVFITLSLGLVGCGGKNSDTGSTNTSISLPTTTTPNINLLQGTVVKGPLNNALVFVDYNNNGIMDAGEPSTRTKSDGSFSLQSAIPGSGFVAISDDKTTDTFTGQPMSGVTLKAPAGATVVTPATTLYVEIKESDPEIKTTDLASALGLGDVNILDFNPFSKDADPVLALKTEKVSSQIITTITSISAAGEGAGATKDKAYEKALSAVTSVISTKIKSAGNDNSQEQSSSSSTKIDFADNSLLSEVNVAAKNELASILYKLNIPAKDLIRKSEAIYKQQYKNQTLSEDEFIEIMVENPILIERPIFTNENKGVVGRPPEKVLEII